MTLLTNQEYRVLSVEDDTEVIQGKYLGYDADCDVYMFLTADCDPDSYECLEGEDEPDCYFELLT